MKKVKKQINLTFEGITNKPIIMCGDSMNNPELTLTFTYLRTSENIDFDKLEHFIEVDEPETIKEFCEMHNMPKKEVVEWLNKNYK